MCRPYNVLLRQVFRELVRGAMHNRGGRDRWRSAYTAAVLHGKPQKEPHRLTGNTHTSPRSWCSPRSPSSALPLPPA